MFIIDATTIEDIAKETVGWPESRRWDANLGDGRFRSLFGVSSRITANIWNRVVPSVNGQAHPKHLLWALVFLKVYSSEEVQCAIVGWPDVKCFCKWLWYFITRVASLKKGLINLGYRFKGLENGNIEINCFLSVDRIDCVVQEPMPFDPVWYSHKFNGPAVKYEIGICIQTCHIVWINGPHPAGKINDGELFKRKLLCELCDDKAVEVDNGYS